MSDTQLPKALQLAELVQAAVQTYPQQGEDEPGGYCPQVDQLLDEAAAELIRLDARETELLHHVCVLQGMNDESLESIRALTAELEQARAALAAQGEPVGEVFTMEALGTPGKPFCHVLLSLPLPTGTKLYTHPAPAASVLDVISTVRERYRGTKWGKAAECICDAVDEAIIAQRPAQPAASVSDEKWPKLDKPATVGAGTFGVGVSSRLVIEAAQRRHEYKAEQAPKTKEQMQAEEANRRTVWDMLHGSPAASVSDERIDAHLDNILRAAGSALRHYTMQKSKDDMRAALRTAILALRPAQAGVPEGWNLVPVEPTPEMKSAGINVEVYSEVSDSIGALTWAEVDAIYRAMLAAAPKEGGAA